MSSVELIGEVVFARETGRRSTGGTAVDESDRFGCFRVTGRLDDQLGLAVCAKVGGQKAAIHSPNATAVAVAFGDHKHAEFEFVRRFATERLRVAGFRTVVWGFLRDRNVMGMTFSNTCGRDTNELRFRTQFFNSWSTAVPHTSSEAPHKLIDVWPKATLKRDSTFDTFRYQFSRSVGSTLAITF